MAQIDNWRANTAYVLEKPYGMKKQVAQAADMSNVHLSNLLAGRKEPGLGKAVALANVLGIPLQDFFLLPRDFQAKYPRGEEGRVFQRNMSRKKVAK